MTIAQTKARRHHWQRIDKRYSEKRKDPVAAQRKHLEKMRREQERIQRSGKKK